MAFLKKTCSSCSSCSSCFKCGNCFKCGSYFSCPSLDYNFIQEKILFLSQLTIVSFSLLLLIYNEQIFGIQLTFVSLRYHPVGETLTLLVLLLSALANFIASNNNTTFCLNAIYSIVFLFIIIAHGTFYIRLKREKKLEKKKKAIPFSWTLFKIQLINFLVVAVIVTFDYLFYNFQNKQWFLVCCLFALTNYWNLFKYFVFLLGFLINYIVGGFTTYYWILYTTFSILLILLTWLRTWELKILQSERKNEP